MSPPCVGTIFEGDNGGTTFRGVTGTEIRVGVPVSSVDTAKAETVKALFDYFNQRFEFYGRQLVPVFASGPFGNAVDARSLGAQVAAQTVFAASTSAAEWNGATVALASELGRQGIVTVTRATSEFWSDRTLYDAFHPYVWSVYPSAEDVQRNVADFLCTSLVGRRAIYARDATLQGKERQIGVVAYGRQTPIPAGELVRSLTDCAGAAPTQVDLLSAAAPDIRGAVERLRSSGTTTVVCLCASSYVSSVMSQANTVGFYPEWIMTPTNNATGNDEHWLQPLRANNQVAPPIRIDGGPRLLPVQARPWFSALQSIVSSPPQGVSFWQVAGLAEAIYPTMLVLAAGIQGAGPTLTADTFAQALLSAQFPNPGAGQAPYWQPSAGFGPGDHSLYDDFDIGWWSDQATALDLGQGLSTSPQGSWCYLHQAARFRPGSYPTDATDQLFNPSVPCR